MMRALLFFTIFAALSANAAQVAEVIVPNAKVFLYPQSSSKVINTLNQGESLTISNLPTEGFYKVRLPNGELGWVSGNDVLAGASGKNGSADLPAIPSAEPSPRKKNTKHRQRTEEDEDTTAASDDSFRLLIGYGVQYDSFGGVSSAFENTAALNPVKHFSLEGQFRMSHSVYWGLRVESISSASSTQIDSSNAQTLDLKAYTVQMGIIWSPVSSHRFRFGLGGYLGATPSTSLVVTNTNSSSGTVNTLTYNTIEACATVAAQFSLGLGERIGLFAEGAYRYDQTGKNPDATLVTAVPGFKIDYSGVMATAGIEFRL